MSNQLRPTNGFVVIQMEAGTVPPFLKPFEQMKSTDDTHYTKLAIPVKDKKSYQQLTVVYAAAVAGGKVSKSLSSNASHPYLPFTFSGNDSELKATVTASFLGTETPFTFELDLTPPEPEDEEEEQEEEEVEEES